ncbi:hypothetical protein [Psychroserpens sp. S379A]|uniref:hypothetical protein n=1 Tax=Psychroserpens sp. S379A TaxID=3415137 RepID=UPI003C7A78A5
MKHLLFLLTSMLFVVTATAQNNTNMNSIFEIAINQSKDGEHQNFLDTRAKFVEVLGKEDATLNEGKWNPFFTVMPNADLSTILVGMTEWNSMQGFGEAAARLLPQDEAVAYFSSFNPLAYALLEPVDGKPFDMKTIKKEGTVVEFAIRKGKTTDAFGEVRNTFFNSLNNYEGYQFAREFKVYKLNEKGMPTLAEHTQAVVIVWDNAEKFQAAATPIFNSKAYADFAGVIDVETYFATSPTK